MSFLTSFKSSRPGFTLIELILVIGIIALLALIVIVAINPARQFIETRNEERRADANTVLNALYQYAIDNNGTLPGNIPEGADEFAAREICASSVDCETCRQQYEAVCLRELTEPTGTEEEPGEPYIEDIPKDPLEPKSGTGTSYFIFQDPQGRVTILAPEAEGDPAPTIKVTR